MLHHRPKVTPIQSRVVMMILTLSLALRRQPWQNLLLHYLFSFQAPTGSISPMDESKSWLTPLTITAVSLPMSGTRERPSTPLSPLKATESPNTLPPPPNTPLLPPSTPPLKPALLNFPTNPPTYRPMNYFSRHCPRVLSWISLNYLQTFPHHHHIS